MDKAKAEINTVIKARVTLVMTGYGDLTLTNTELRWDKSISSYIAFGAMNAATEDHLSIPLSELAQMGTYTYFPGGGLVITTKPGKQYKIAFKHKKDFKIVHDYLLRYLNS